MKVIDSNNHLQSEALLNEYKGNLFEYLVGNILSREMRCESKFLEGINSEHKLRLSMYEEFIRLNYPQLIYSLSDLALQTAKNIKIYLQNNQISLINIHLIGKSVAVNDNALWGETDLVLDSNVGNLKISLKLSKDHSYTNTKSAGVKSFIEKYFKDFVNSANDQQKFSHEIDFQFNKMGEALYAEEGLVFNGQFNSEWTHHYPELPGELNDNHRNIVFNNYAAVNLSLYEIIKKYFEEDKQKFLSALIPLIGLSDKEIIQVTTFHKNHQFESTKIFSLKEFDLEKLDVELLPLKPSSHFFEVRLFSHLLQIRIKPMNKFTTASYKVNCSVKGPVL